VALVLLHPVGLDARTWQFLDIPGAISHEYPGHGLRIRESKDFTLGSLADELMSLYSAPIDLAGLSLGGVVAQQAAIRHPQLVRSLFIACAPAVTDRPTMLRRAQSVSLGGMDSVVESTLERWFSSEALTDSSHVGVAYARRCLMASDALAFAACWRAMAEHDARKEWPSVQAHATCVAASDDLAVPSSAVQEVSRLLPRARFQVLKGPHMLQLESPSILRRAIVRHLAWINKVAPIKV